MVWGGIREVKDIGLFFISNYRGIENYGGSILVYLFDFMVTFKLFLYFVCVILVFLVCCSLKKLIKSKFGFMVKFIFYFGIL